MKSMVGRLILLAVLMVLMREKTQAATYAHEVWISTNATGNFLSKGAAGTSDNPLDGSDANNFDANLNALPNNTFIHILPGTFQTGGGCHAHLKTGQKVLGSGMDVTTIQLSTNTTLFPYPENVVMTSSGGAIGIEVSDLTFDGNYLPGTAYNRHGLSLAGTHHSIRRVKVIHCAKYNPSANTEAWGILISTYGCSFHDSTRNIIEDCEVSHFAGAYNRSINLSAISFMGLTNTAISGIIRNNRVLTTGDYPCFAFGIGCCAHDVLIQGNYAENITVGCSADTPPGFTNIMIVNNTLNGCECALDFENLYANNITFAFNRVVLTNTTFNLVQAFKFNMGSQNNSTQTNIVIFDNRISCTSTNANPKGLIGGGCLDGFIYENNVSDPSLTNCLNLPLRNALIDHNRDLNGNDLTNIDTVRDR